jgi:TrkA domain protein
LHLSAEDTTALGELLGLSHVSETVRSVQQLEGVAIDWISVPPGAAVVGTTIGDGQFRTQTGASIVAVIRGKTTIPAPGPDVSFDGDDVVVAVGTTEGLRRLRSLLAP